MSTAQDHLLDELRMAAEGGRVRTSPFLAEERASALRHALRALGVACHVQGGVAGAHRRVITVRPDGVPDADVTLVAVGISAPIEPEDLHARLLEQGVDDDALGDCLNTEEGPACIIRSSEADGLPMHLVADGQERPLMRWPLDALPQGRERTFDRVVASLRADVIGAAAFGASRTWFAKGIRAGHVRIDGSTVGKAATLEAGSELWAEGLGRATLVQTHGLTKRGNVRVTLHVETPPSPR